MKAQTVSVGVMSGLWLAATAAAVEPPIYDIPRLDSIVVDGKADDWGESGFRVDQLAPIDGRFRPVADHDSHCRLGWSEQGLLAIVWVRDDRWEESLDDTKLWTRDCVELYLAPSKGHESICQWVIAPGMDQKHTALRWHLNDFRRTESLKGLPADLQAARSKAGQGCVVEVLIPWSALAIQPKTGVEVGFQLWTTDYDPGKPGQYYAAWYQELGTFFMHQNVHRVRLAKDPSPPVLARAFGDYSLSHARSQITVTAPAAQAGQAATVRDGNKVIASDTLATDDAGRARAVIGLAPPPVGRPYRDLMVQMADSSVATISLPFSDRVVAIAGMHRRVDQLRRTFRLDAPWDDMAGAPVVQRRHRGMVERALRKLAEAERGSTWDFSFLVQAAEMVEALDRGVDFLASKRNSFWSAYYSQADGSGQPFVVHVPSRFDPRKAYPLVVRLHGRTGRPAPNLDAVHEKPYLGVEPWGRGDTGYSGLGDNDVLEVIRYMTTWYRVDPNRVYVTGDSMGGWGTWAMASRHPDLFAAAAPVCGWAVGLPIENLQNVPVLNQHGRADWSVSIDGSRWAVDRLREWGYAVVHKEHPGEGHAIHNLWPADEWLLRYHRPEHPAAITYTCDSPADGRAYWLTIRRFADAHQPVTVQAAVIGHGPGQAVSLHAPNAEVLELDTAGMGVDPKQDLLVNVDIEMFTIKAPLKASVLMQQSEGAVKLIDSWPLEPGPLRAYQPGGAANLYTGEPLLVVYGTRAGPEQTAKLQAAAEKLSHCAGVPWNEMETGGFRVRADRDVTTDDLQRHNLLLVGGSPQSELVDRLLSRAPLKVTDQRELVVAGRAPVNLHDAVLGLSYYNPEAPQRLMVVLWPDLDSPQCGPWADSPQWSLPGLSASDRVAAADLIVRAFGPGRNGTDRCRLQFTHGWQWRSLPGADQKMPAEFGPARRMTELTARLLRRGADADFALVQWPDEEQWAYDPAHFTWADYSVQQGSVQTLTGCVSGQELLEIQERFVTKEKRLFIFPEVKSPSVEPDRRYRLVMPVWVCGTLSSRERNLQDVAAGPTLLPEVIRAELHAQMKGTQ